MMVQAILLILLLLLPPLIFLMRMFQKFHVQRMKDTSQMRTRIFTKHVVRSISSPEEAKYEAH